MKYDFGVLMATLIIICAMSVRCLPMKDPMKEDNPHAC